uniref:Exonuclease 1 n=1 Tax=Hyaloperonospora arabidopsidis (strain Emoy2) TaxID=559515 RepID=M4C612_HYAAE
MFYVAPYEADAQLAFLSRHKIVDVVISDDSDCVPYGVKTVLFKLGATGWGSELKRRSLGANEDLSFNGWTEEMVRVLLLLLESRCSKVVVDMLSDVDEQFLQLCVLAGCDYCPSIYGVGIVTAYKLVSQYKTPAEVLKALQQKTETLMPKNFAEQFYSAILTYRHQLVFDPRDDVSLNLSFSLYCMSRPHVNLLSCQLQKLKMLNPLDVSMDILPRVDKGLHFLGNVELRDDVVACIASGQIHPVTHESYAWKNTAAAVLCEEQTAASLKQRRTRSSTSSESSGIVLPRRLRRNTEVVTAGSTYTPSGSSQEEPIPSTKKSREAPRVRYEKPRPSSRSSWMHLNSVLGSSDHIVNFRSPKVSENFTPLAALHKPPVSTHTSSMDMLHLKKFDRRPMHSHAKRVRNPTNRRRDGKGSGFEGEVLCRVDQGHTPNFETSSDSRLSLAGALCHSDRLTDDAEGRLPQKPKRPRVFERPPSVPSTRSSPASEDSSRKQLVRPTPFGCDNGRSSTSSNDNGFHWTLPPRHSQQPRSLLSRTATSASNYAFTTSAEEKWDRILGDEIDDDGTNSSGSQIED